MLHTWLSHRDLTELVRCCLSVPVLGHTIVYGISNNRDPWWSNAGAAHLGYKPLDSAEPFRALRERQAPLDPQDPARIHQGGAFVKQGPFEIGF